MKKTAAIFLCLVMLFGLMPVMAAETKTNLLGNGDLEFAVSKEAEGASYAWPAGWVASGGGVENETCYLVEDAYSGKYAMAVDGGTEGKNTRVSAQLSGIVIGAPYELTAYVKCEGLGKGVRIFARASSDYGNQYPQNSILVMDTGGKWEKITTKFVAQKKNPYVWVNNYGPGKVLVDTVTVTPCKDYAINGSFEEGLRNDTSKTRLPGWEGGTLNLDGALKVNKDNPFDGEKYITISAGNENNTIACDFENAEKTRYFTVDKTYTLHFAATADRKVDAVAKVEYIDGEKMVIGEEKLAFSTKDKVWTEYSLDFAAPKDAVRVRVSLSGAKNEISYDGVRIDCADINELVKEEKITTSSQKPPYGDSVNLISNADFEAVNADAEAVGFAAYKGFDGGFTSVSHENPHSGKNCIKVMATEDGKNPWVRFLVTGVVPEATYQVSAFLRRVHVLNDIGPHVKFEFYKNGEISKESANGSQDSHSFIKESEAGKWSEVSATVKVPAGTESVALYFRLNYLGEIYWDDVSFYMVEPPVPVTGEPNHIFYYTDMKTGIYTANVSESFGAIPAGAYMDFALEKDGAVIEEMKNIPAQKETKFEFSIAKLLEQGAPYTARVQFKNADGSLIGTAQNNVYRYDRPPLLTKDGKYIVDGEVFTPVLGYHVFHFTDEVLTKVKQTGVNVIQLSCGTDFEATRQTLDTLHSYGMKAFLCLYLNMKPAAHPDNYDNSVAAVKALKDHPAVFAYAVQDEPYLHGTFEEISDLLEKSYKLIRDLDPVHPVMLVESASSRAFYKYDALYCDIFNVDPYARYDYRMPTWTGEIGQMSKEAGNGVKPGYSILQACLIAEYTPTPNSMLHMAYQHYFEGGEGLGYFRFETSSGSPEIPNMWDYELWNGALTLGEGGEIDELEDLFINGKYPIIGQAITDTYSYIAYVKDNTPYIILINRVYDKETPVEIPLTSYNGAVSIGSFTASIDKGIGLGGDLSGDGVFKMTLRPSEAAKYKLTLANPVDFSAVPGMTYRDLGRHPWARMQIEALKAKGIVNDASNAFYLPGRNITRADFAGFLVRTLGLSADVGTDSFADVNPNSEFAKEIAIGRALGVLNGIGDNLYAPLAEISRQDMMTIISRALSLNGDGYNISVYPDAGSIADYALPHVKAMMQAGIVKGNADGTINPLGNTTRAEAAVMMHRILNK